MADATLKFPDEKTRDSFMSWLSSQGEQYFFDWESERCRPSERNETPADPIVRMNYAKAFPAWGYDKKRDGEPIIEAQAGDSPWK